MSNEPPDKDDPYQAPVVAQSVYYPHLNDEGDSTGGLIPYKNPKALIAYYLGIGSLLIFPLGFASIILGFMGLAARKRNPAIKGSVHAWIGIVFGALSIICAGTFITAMIISIVSSGR